MRVQHSPPIAFHPGRQALARVSRVIATTLGGVLPLMPSWRVSSVLKTMFGDVSAGSGLVNKELGDADGVGDR